ncbi:hypothetical protein AB835_03165 [Candidatus Endobugula sertula]|uniref:Uncharacterized protein n=1 Tax=Candidatus Endobugula sertula TaxID=62101 RepID=A0A1D2QSN0_9GAMM|nr:hypothetical protein AB835_03165 [Candidatus Endobugula sertula]
MSQKVMPEKWKAEEKFIKAIQVAFDLDEQVQYVIRREALDLDINPSERIRQILGLEMNRAPQRPRLSISLRPKDFQRLAEKYGLDSSDRKSIKQQATNDLQKYVEKSEFGNQ